MNIQRSLRQLCYPKEFRIRPGFLPNEDVENVIDLLKKIEGIISVPPGPPPEPPLERKVVASWANNIWELKNRVNTFQMKIPNDFYVRRVMDTLDRMDEILEETGARIIDETGKPLSPGDMRWDRIGGEPKPDLKESIIGETIKPAVYYKGELIQRGQIIVYYPEKEENENVQDNH